MTPRRSHDEIAPAPPRPGVEPALDESPARGIQAPSTNASIKVEIGDDGHGGKRIAARIPGWLVASILGCAGLGAGGLALGAHAAATVDAPPAVAPMQTRIAVLEAERTAEEHRLDAIEARLERIDGKVDKIRELLERR